MKYIKLERKKRDKKLKQESDKNRQKDVRSN